jgi:ribosome-binding protein aMBF1 (putative translation factor)
VKREGINSNDSLPHINVDYFDDLTGKITKSDSTEIGETGERIKTLRKEKGFSIEDLPGMTGFTPELLSKIESMEVLPQLGTVVKLSNALDTAIGGLLSGEVDKPYTITRMGDRQTVSRSTAKGGK